MTKIPSTLAALTTAALLVLAAPAYASHGDDDGPGDDHGNHQGGGDDNGGGNGGGGGGNDDRVIKTGDCTDGTNWKLKVKTDDGRLEVEGEVDSNQSGQSWNWKIKDNGSVAAMGTDTTSGRSGSFSVERKISNKPGTDTVVFRATHSGEVCTGTIAF
jgi:hypothetical protein